MEETKEALLEPIVDQDEKSSHANDEQREDIRAWPYIHYGNAVLFGIISYTGGFLTFVYSNFPWNEPVCHNSTSP
jgi:hypothetical protein